MPTSPPIVERHPSADPVPRVAAVTATPRNRRLPVSAGIEIAIVLGVFVVYKAVRFMVRDDAAVAFANARELVGFERSIGLWSEPTIQSVAVRWQPVIEALNWFYARVHLVSTAAVLILLFIVDRSNYLWLRRRLVWLTFLALGAHLFYPLAPPRMVASTGMIDTLQRFGPAIYHHGSALNRIANPFAAMPSLHFGFAVLIACALARSWNHRARALLALHPLAMLVAIVATANHYWLDAIASVVLMLVVERGLGWFDRTYPERAMLNRA